MSLLNGTMVPIYTVTVGAGGQAAIQFNNIPQTYTDLVIKLSVRTNRSGTYEGGIGIGINGNESTGYTWRTIEVQGTNVTSKNTSYEADWVARVPASETTASVFSNIDIYIPNYTSSNAKSYFADAVGENNSTAGSITLLAGVQSSTSAITSLRIADKQNGLIVQHSTATLYGIKNYSLTQIGEGAKASGGIVTSDASYYYHTFTTSGTFTPTQNLTADYLVVGGGGAGGNAPGGGGGAGGYVPKTSTSFTGFINYPVTIGAGGASSRGSGSNSTFNSITALGGGGGGSNTTQDGANGGSGGGGGAFPDDTFSGGTATQPGSGSGGFGENGGSGVGTSIYRNGGGGGGAGAAGSNASNSNKGNGGTGKDWLNGTYYAGGGGGCYTTNTSGGGSGGTGGGGAGGGTGSSPSVGTAGTANTGGGGGGARSGNFGSGGSGIVIIRYPK